MLVRSAPKQPNREDRECDREQGGDKTIRVHLSGLTISVYQPRL
jgi:hypothetical protein